MNPNEGEDTPLLRPNSSRVEGRSHAQEPVVLERAAANRSRVGFVLVVLFALYGYILFSTEPIAHHVVEPTNTPTYQPSRVVSPSFRPTVRPSAAITLAPAASANSTVAPSAAPTTRPSQSGVCESKESFQESAARLVHPAFEMCDFSVRSTIEVLKNKLGTYSFAYFPLESKIFTYETWTVSGMDTTPIPPEPVLVRVNTSDPMEALVYYINSIYTAIGDLADCHTGNNLVKVERMEALVLNLTWSWNQTVGRDIIPGLSWDSYLRYPGPSGREWPGGETVTWAKESNYHDVNSALFLGHSDRMKDEQLWGGNAPVQGSSAVGGIETLIRRQVKEAVERYKELLSLDPHGAGNWATPSTLATDFGIITYHRVRKVLRMLGITIDAFPEVVSAFYDKIPNTVVDFVNKNYDAEIESTRMLAYGDMFCFSDMHKSNSFSSEKYKCQRPIVSIGTMIFANLSAFDADFFGIDQISLNALRIILMIKAFRLGERQVLRNTTGCPSLHSSYASITNSSRHSFTKDPFEESDDWVRPELSPNGYSILGTVCNIDDYFGDIHDLLVKMQQNSTVVDHSFLHYTVKVARGLQVFLETLNLNRALEKDLLSGLCSVKS